MVKMEYDEIKDKVRRYVQEKEGLDDKDTYFLFKDLSDDLWEDIKGSGEEEPGEGEDDLDLDMSEETSAEEPELEPEAAFGPDPSVEEAEEEPEEEKETEVKPKKKGVFAKKPKLPAAKF